jgi:CheY-like chemotaxis protein
MNKNGTIIIIEDDAEDQEVLAEIFKKMGHPNKILYFFDGIKALEYLENSNDKPFIIISDINLPKLSGIALRDKLHNNEQLRIRCIPYLFLTTSIAHRDVIEAYSKSVQGFFIKPVRFSELERMMQNIINYWKDCTAPNYMDYSN